MDINGDPSENEGTALRESTIREIAILRRVAGHPYISIYAFNRVKEMSVSRISNYFLVL